jgi:hypothetical protein
MANEANKQPADTLHCWACKKEIGPTDRFCPYCGANVRGGSVVASIIKCPTCKKPILSQVEFCPNCGENIAEANVATTATGNGASISAAPSANIQAGLQTNQGLLLKTIIGVGALLLLGGWILLQFFGSGR